jgi:dTDP-4-dehydrorhamnose 3,5-epimerase
MQFYKGTVAGVIWKPLHRHHDARGWLCELFRADEVPAEYHPVMAYVSATEPGVCRGPHEHTDQADCFCFVGPSQFLLALWDNRPASTTYRAYQHAVVGQDNPMLVIIPPGVVHGYRNIGPETGWVINCPNRLYRGPGRAQSVDEIRHELDPTSPFRMDSAADNSA